jgi:hypothetical protein
VSAAHRICHTERDERHHRRASGNADRATANQTNTTKDGIGISLNLLHRQRTAKGRVAAAMTVTILARSPVRVCAVVHTCALLSVSL